MKKLITSTVAGLLALSMSGCTSSSQTDARLISGLMGKSVNTELVDLVGEDTVKLTDFAVRLFKESLDSQENTMISPVSVLYALAMTANGAKGETLAQMESVFGLDMPTLNLYLKAYMDALPSHEKYKLSIADSIWLKADEHFKANRDFLQTNADYYGAEIFEAPFDGQTLADINSWVNDKTDGMIEDILDEIPENAVMYLVNAVAFDAEWKNIYNEYAARDGIFTTEKGEKQSAKLMYSDERYYLEDENATGFIKHYADSKYAFAALLPKEGMSVRDYAATLTGQSLSRLLANPEKLKVNAALPRFESEYSVEMSDILKSMGMKTAFDEDFADFTGLGTSDKGNIYINRVLHKTYIAVDEKGTKAGAATAVEMVTKTAVMIEDSRTVILDRPFVYMIIDCEAKLPLFIGVLTDLG